MGGASAHTWKMNLIKNPKGEENHLQTAITIDKGKSIFLVFLFVCGALQLVLDVSRKMVILLLKM